MFSLDIYQSNKPFQIAEHVQFERNNRGPCPSCRAIGKNNNQNNLSLLPNGAYKCHRGCTADEIRDALGRARRSEGSYRETRKSAAAAPARAPKPVRDTTVDEKAVRFAAERLLQGKNEAATKARAWLEGRGIDSAAQQRYQLGLSQALHRPDPKRQDSKEYFPAISIFIQHPDTPGRYYQKKRVAPWLTEDERPEKLKKWSQYGVPATLWFPHEPPNSAATWIAEGEWDAIVLSELVRTSGGGSAVCTGTAGVGTPPSDDELRRIPTSDVVLWFDRNDAAVNGKQAGEEGILRWVERLEAMGKSVMVGLVPMPDGCDVKGWDVTNAIQAGFTYDDFNKNEAMMPIEEFRKRLIEREQLERSDRQDAPPEKRGGGRPPTRPPAQALAAQLASGFSGQLAWNDREDAWYIYEDESPGVWSSVTPNVAEKLIGERLCEAIGPVFGSAYRMDVLKTLRLHLLVKKWREAEHLLPLLDGVLDKRTLALKPHSPSHRFTWSLPIRWSDRDNGCEPIKAWMKEAMNGDTLLVELLRGILNCVVFQRSKLHRYLEAVGPGGTGKGTFFALAAALVGDTNTTTTTLRQLEESRFELASLKSAKLLLINEAEKFGGEANALKSLTGGDLNRTEMKGKQRRPGDDFRFQGFVLVSANESPQYTDHTSGVARRRLSLPFTHQVSSRERRDLLEEFAPYMAGLLGWVITMPEADVIRLVRDTDYYVPQLHAAKMKTLCDTNPLADWLDNRIVIDSYAKTYVGIRNSDRTHTWLYANYCVYTEGVGTKPVSMRRFANLLEDLCINQLHIEGVTRGKDRSGSFFQGLAIRTDADKDLPLPLTERVMDGDRGVMDSVMGETLTGDGLDGCDGKFGINSIEIGMPEEIGQFQNECELICVDEENGSNPSHLLPETPVIPAGQGFQAIEQSIAQATEPSHHPSQANDIYIDVPDSAAAPAEPKVAGHTFQPGERVKSIDAHEYGVPCNLPSTIQAVRGTKATLVNNRGVLIENVDVSRLAPWTD